MQNLPARLSETPAKVDVFEILHVALVEPTNVSQRCTPQHQETAGNPVAGKGRKWIAIEIEVITQRFTKQWRQSQAPRGDRGRCLKTTSGKTIAAVRVIDA